MIHLALWIVSTLFVLWFFAVCGVLVLGFIVAFWRWIVGAIAVIALLILVNTHDGKKSQSEPVAQGVSAWDATLSPPVPALPPGPTASDLSDATRTAYSSALAGAAPPVPQFSSVDSRLAYLRWLGALSTRLKPQIPDWQQRKEFLQTVWYESKRAGLDTGAVLGVIEASSNFRQYHVSENGSRGYMSVAPTWSAKIGDGEPAKLFHLQTNVRFGCVLLAHFLNARGGDLQAALRDYYASNVGNAGGDAGAQSFAVTVLGDARHWMYVDQPPPPPVARAAPSAAPTFQAVPMGGNLLASSSDSLCRGYSGPGGACYSGPGGGLFSGPGGGKYSGPGGGLYSGPGGGLYTGPGGGMYSGPGGGLYTGPGGGLYSGPGGGIYSGPPSGDGYKGPWSPCITGVLGSGWMRQNCPQ